MSSNINMIAIIIANCMGLLLIFTVAIGNIWRIKQGGRENKIILLMMILVVISCIADPFAFLFDGKAGILFRIINYFTNSWQYVANVLMGVCWIDFISGHVHFRIGKVQHTAAVTASGIGILLLMINIFVPIVFTIDSNNVYSRGLMYGYYFVVESVLLVYGIGIYLFAKRKGGMLTIFPVWIFIIPLVVGIALQTAFYGLSTIWPCLAISVSGVMAGLQNEVIFRDTLTGLFNRFYLDEIKKKIGSGKNRGNFTAIMMDLNGFKTINDDYGHREGDNALRETAKILTKVVGTGGLVIRYAGDEFVVVLNTQDDQQVEKYIADIEKGFEEFSASGSKPYGLSASMGCSKCDLRQLSVDDILNEVDQKMYRNKREFYALHPQVDRRHADT